MEKILILAILAFLNPSDAQLGDLSGCGDSAKVIDTSFQPKGDIYSPGYPQEVYPSNLYCRYLIRAQPRFNIKVAFKELDIDPFDLCEKDQLTIYEGGDASSPVIGFFCGNNTPTDVYSKGNLLFVEFRSDFFVGRKGFHLQYEAGATLQPCSSVQTMCRNRKCYTYIEKCDGQDNCGDGTDEENCGKPLPSIECGVPEIKSFSEDWTDRVIGGKASVPGSWPWQADLQLAVVMPNGHMCGGTLINAQWVLSAAHCFEWNFDPEEWRIHFGNYRKYEKDPYEQVRYAEKIFVFPRLVENEPPEVDMANDIALVKLNAPVKFTEHVKPACLPSQGQDLTSGTKCMATGWGMTRGYFCVRVDRKVKLQGASLKYESTGSSDVLKEVEMTVQTAEECDSIFSQFENKTMICVRNAEGYQDVCHGDSGGPLVCETDDRWYVMGATSYGTDGTFDSGLCALPQSRTVFAKVSDKSTWIYETISKYS